MTRDHEFKFSEEEITERINALYELENDLTEAQAEDRDLGIYEAEGQELRRYFECLADNLWKAGAFKSRDEARQLVRADTGVLEHVGGPGGVAPDDGQLDPNEIAQGLVALKAPTEFIFQAPLCYLLHRRDVELVFNSERADYRITSNFADLRLVKNHPNLNKVESANLLWFEGSIKEHRYIVARSAVDQLVASLMGLLLVAGIVRYAPWGPGPAGEMAIGTPDFVNSGVYWTMLSLRLSKHLIGLVEPAPENDVDRVRTEEDRLMIALRAVGRALTESGEQSDAVRQAGRMFLRSHDVWNAGEAGMYLAITLEGLMLDKRQKEDLGARLQDSVAYWLGGSAPNRDKSRKAIADLYRVRSAYVHNGDQPPPAFDLEVARELTRRVIAKELLTLGIHS